MNTYLNKAYQAGCAQAMHDFTKSANWRDALLGGVKPSGRGSAASLVLGGVGGAAAAPYLNQEDWDESSSLSKAWQRFQGGLLGASSALTGHNRFGLAGTLGGLGVGVGANYGLSAIAPEGESMGARAGNAAIEAIKSSMGASLLANSMFRGGGIRNALDGIAYKQLSTFGESGVRAEEARGVLDFADRASKFKKDPYALALPVSIQKRHGVPVTRGSDPMDLDRSYHSIRHLTSSGAVPMLPKTTNNLVGHLDKVVSDSGSSSWAREEAQVVLDALKELGLEGATDQGILRKLHVSTKENKSGAPIEVLQQLGKSVGMDDYADTLRHFYDTSSVDSLQKKFLKMSPAELAKELRQGYVEDDIAPLYEGLYEKILMGPVDSGGPGKWVSDLRGVKQGPVSKGIDYWLGSPEVAALVKEHGGLNNVPAGKYLASMGKDIGIGSAIALGAAPVGAAYGAVSDALATEEPWYNRATPYKIVRRDD